MRRINVTVNCLSPARGKCALSVGEGETLAEMLARCSEKLGAEVLGLYDAAGNRLRDPRDAPAGGQLLAAARPLPAARPRSQGAKPLCVFNFSVAVLGAPRVGKSAFILRFTRNFFQENYASTASAVYKKEVEVRQAVYNLEVLDTAGQESFHALRPGWVRDRDVFVIAVSLENVDLQEAMGYHAAIAAAHANAVIALVVTKLDLLAKAAEPAKKLAELRRARAFAEERGWLFFETSAKLNKNVCSVFVQLIERKYGVATVLPRAPPAAESKSAWLFRLCRFPCF